MVKVGVKLGRTVKVAEGDGEKVSVGVAVRGLAVAVGRVGTGVGPAAQLQPNKRQPRHVRSSNLKLERIGRYLAGRSTFTLLIQLPATRKINAPRVARPKRSGPMLHIIQL